jgi:hypothetical protein
MIKVLRGILFVVVINVSGQKSIEDLKKDFLFNGLGIYLEKTFPDESHPDRYTLDNRIYTIKRKFIFDYLIIRQRDTLKVKTLNVRPPDDFERAWEFIDVRASHADKIETISISVEPGISNESQTMLKYEYQHPSASEYNNFQSTSGLIENSLNIWMHPHRDKYFMILELNPFPYIEQPFQVGHKWQWELGIGSHWGDLRWKRWNGSVRNRYEYEIVGREKLKTKIGVQDCWIIKSTATSEIGSTSLLAYFNEKNGFVKLDYTNIDKSKLIIEIKEIR